MSNPLDKLAKAILPSLFGDDPEAVTLRVGTSLYEGYESISISRSLDSLASSFAVEVIDKWRDAGELWPFVPGEQIRVNIGEDPVFNGYIDTLGVSISGDDRNFAVTGRSKTSDLVDCSVLSKSYAEEPDIFGRVADNNEFKNQTILDIAKFFCFHFGITVSAKAPVGDPFKVWTIKQGETVFETLDRAAKLRGLLLLTDTDGNLVISDRKQAAESPPSIKAPAPKFDFVAAVTGAGASSSVDLIQGENVLTASAEYDNAERFSDYIVKGQTAGSDIFNTRQASQVTATAKDEAVKRFRPLMILPDGSVDKATAKQRAQWEAIVRAANGIDVKVTVQGWRRPDGKLWEPNEIIRAEIPFVGIDSQMLINSVTYTKNSGGTITELALTRPDAWKTGQDVNNKTDPAAVGLGWKPAPMEGIMKQLTGLIG